MAKLRQEMFRVEYQNGFEEFRTIEWALTLAYALKKKGVDVEITYNGCVVFVYEGIFPPELAKG